MPACTDITHVPVDRIAVVDCQLILAGVARKVAVRDVRESYVIRVT